MNNLSSTLDNIKKNYYINIRTQTELSVGDVIHLFFLQKEKKEHDFEGIIISKHFTEKSKMFSVQRFIDGINFIHIINMSSPFIESIEIIKNNKPNKAKLYYTRFLSEKVINFLFKN